MDGGDAGAGDGDGDGVRVSVFDESVENHFKAMETISKLCGEEEEEEEVNFFPDDSEFQRLSSSIRFLREWKQFEYQPRKVKFASEVGGSHGKRVTGEVTLPQFSSATVPKVEDGLSGASKSSSDFVLYVGGSVWALDWCPKVHREPDNDFKCEFVAVAAHPPESYYHKVGAPLTGRGMVQIWCILNTSDYVEAPTTVKKMRQAAKSTKEPGRPRGRPRKKVEEFPDGGAISKPKPRGRPRKNPSGACPDSSGCIEQPIYVQYPECSAQLLALDGIPDTTKECANGSTKRNKRKILVERASGSVAAVKTLNGSKLEEDLGVVKKPRGRSRKKAANACPDRLDCNELIVRCSEGSSELLMLEGPPDSTQECDDRSRNGRRRTRRIFTNVASSSNKSLKVHSQSRSIKKNEPKCVGSVASIQNGDKRISPVDQDMISEQDVVAALSVQAQAVCLGEGPPELLALEEDTEKNQQNAHQVSSGKRRDSVKETSNNSALKTPKPRISRRVNAGQSACDATCPQNENEGSSPVNHQISNSSELDPLTDQSGPSMDFLLIQNGEERACADDQIQENNDQVKMVTNTTPNNLLLDKGGAPCTLPDDVALPRVVLCLAHNGKVVWDMKWRHQKESSSCCLYRMGYLAVLLGNGSLEVWDIPLPRAMKHIYYSSHEDGIDPRFVKLDPVFRCSRFKCGEIQSIPLTVEWSSHDLLLVGCHDGTVALLKFSPTGEDTRPLLCFSADTVPIRAAAWAPVESDQEIPNVIVTAGHVGLKFWDIRDPFRPLWDLHPSPKFIYSLDWLPDPKCLLLSFDDGTMRLLSLVKAAYDAPVNGNPTIGPKQHGLHVFNCSSFSIWSVQVSRLTGMIAYCSADGTVNRFQLTSKVVEKEPARYRTPHFVCGFLSQEESAITVNTPLLVTPFSSKKPVKEIKNEIAVSASSNSIRSRTKNSRKGNGSPDHQPLALCYGDDPGVDSAPEETLATIRNKKKSKSASSLAKDDGKDRALVIAGEDPESLPEKADNAEAADQTETMPPKIVAMHRVRWNMNRGSERWLCSGGAAGIVRVQEIIMTEFDTYLAKNR